MNENLTELVFIVDRSGSMAGMESDTIGGVNAVLEQNRKLEGDALVSVVLFDHETNVLRDREDIQKVPNLTDRDYQVRGCTALLDAVGESVRFIDKIQRYLPEDIRPGKTMFIITTDGYENASKKFTYSQVKRLIERKTEDGWEFLFLGANIDAAAEAERIGIASDRAETYVNDSIGNQV
ncbi:MAG: vWA domain-containing protein, partial [Coriobacteriaceae bacterium]|nr:vWA domain-containing protein [Coriobacteriaceae bacterium]